jgi:hypothetical protein
VVDPIKEDGRERAGAGGRVGERQHRGHVPAGVKETGREAEGREWPRRQRESQGRPGDAERADLGMETQIFFSSLEHRVHLHTRFRLAVANGQGGRQ